MIKSNLNSLPNTDPSDIIKLRDSVYAADLLFTAVGHLDLFSRFKSNPMSFESIVDTFGIKSRPADVMLTYFKSLGLIGIEDRLYHLTEKAAEHLTVDSGFSLNPLISTQIERPIVTKMLDVLTTGTPASWIGKKSGEDWLRSMEREDFAETFTSGMDSRAAYFGPGLVNSFDFSKYNSIIDIAGGSGIYASCIKSRFPLMRAAVLEKPPVDKIAKISTEKRKVDIEIIAADMFKDAFPEGYDIHLYSHVLHDWGVEENRKLIRKSFRSLNKNGMIMIHGAHVNREKNGPLSVAEYSVFIMFATIGKCYSIVEMEDLLSTEGFVDIQYQETVGNRSIITGKKE